MGRLGGAEWLIIILLVVLLFGAKRLPDAARGIGRSLRIFKAETKGLIEDGKEQVSDAAATPLSPAASAAAANAASPSAEAERRTETPPHA